MIKQQLKINYFDEILKESYKTVLHIAVKNKDIDIIKLLMKNKNTNINIKDDISLLFKSSSFIYLWFFKNF